MIAFVHIPKTAGTTLHKILSHQYSRKKTYIHHDSDGAFTKQLAQKLISNQTSLVMGHFSVGLHPFIPSLRYVTCLREPIARLSSHYYHAIDDPSHYLHTEAKKLSFGKYVASGRSGELSNGMTRMLAGVEDFHHSEVTSETYQLAVSNLENLFTTVIPSDRFDLGILRLAQALNLKNPYYLRRKVGRKAHLRKKIEADCLRLAEDHNRYDLALYKLFSERFDRDTATCGISQQQLAAFQKNNATWGKCVFFGREFKMRVL